MASVRSLSSLIVLPFLLADASLGRLHTSGAEVAQASEPVTVQVNYDVPTFGKIAESNMLRQAAAMEARKAQSHGALARLLKRGDLRGKMQPALKSDAPTLNVKLAPPVAPFPELAAKVQQFEHSRVGAETAFAQELAHLYEAELGKARQQIQQLAGASVSVHQTAPLAANFLATDESQDAGFDMRISVVAPAPLSPEISSIVDKIEHKRATLEQRLVNEARGELSTMTSFVLQELRSALGSTAREAVGFLASAHQGLPPQASVRFLSSSQGFSRVADLIKAMELRRDQAESAERKLILETEAKLLKAENAMIREALAR